MRTQDIANLLGLKTTTIRGWSMNQYKGFLSVTAQGGSGRTRQFTEQDARIMALVASLRADGLPHDDIIRSLEVHLADGWVDLPPLPAAPPGSGGPVSMIPEHSAQTALVERERFYLREVSVRDERIDGLETRLTDELEAHDKTRQELMTEKVTSGKLQGNLEAVERERKVFYYLVAGLAVAAVVLLVVVLLLALQGGPV